MNYYCDVTKMESNERVKIENALHRLAKYSLRKCVGWITFSVIVTVLFVGPNWECIQETELHL